MIQAIFTGIEQTILVNLQKATKEIKVAVAWITNPRLFDVLLEQSKAGKTVEIILADDRMNFTNPHINFQSFIDLGGIVRISRYPKLMHHKFCILDNRVLITGSYNWTRNAELNNLENIIVTTELTTIKQFVEAFEALNEMTEKVNAVALVPLHNYTTEEERERELEVVISTDTESEADTTAPEPVAAAIITPLDVSPEIADLLGKAHQLYLQGKHESALKATETILQQRIDLAEVYYLIALIKWRQGKFKEQVEHATKAVKLATIYDAYNTLGIGYAKLGNAQKSIDSYETCLIINPEDYVVLYNRAVSHIDLEEDPKVPIKMKNQFKQKADGDLKTAIALTDKYESEHKDNYNLYYVRGGAKRLLGKFISAKPDLLKALKVYDASPKEIQDVHILREIKAELKEIERAGNTV